VAPEASRDGGVNPALRGLPAGVPGIELVP